MKAPKKKELGPPDSFHLSAAVGWLELGNPAEAEKELDGIGPATQKLFAVQEVRWMILAEQRDWQRAFEVAQGITQLRPERPEGWLHLAYAARRAPAGGLEPAWTILHGAAHRFPKHDLIAFNLACYACQLGRLEEARAWLLKALAAGGKQKMKRMALRDDDLKALWPEIEKM